LSGKLPYDVLAEAAKRFGSSVNSIHVLSGGHYAGVYGFRSGTGEGVLRIVPESDTTTAQTARAILELIRFLAAHGGPVSHPLRSVAGSYLEVIDSDCGTYLVSGFRKALGVLGELLTGDQWDEPMYEALGRATGQLHSLASSYSPVDESLRLPHWDEISNCFNPDESLVSSHPPIAARQAEVLKRVAELPRGPDEYGLIHADLHAANFFVDTDDTTVTIFDFDDCCYGWYAMDIAMAVFDFAVLYPYLEEEKTSRRLLASYWRSYNAEHALDTSWIKEIPGFLKLLEIGVYIDVYQHYDPTDTTSWVGRFMPGRRERIEAGVPYLSVDLERVLLQP
jgi:Ser/Thr protein kinase RdoA (MazF antagonist)